jgi:hypothetical protein
MATKQCTDCGAQMATTARRCPVCGGGVAASDFGMFAFLGVLLLGIGLASGLIPLHRQPPGPEVASAEVVVPARPEKPETVFSSQTPPATRPAVAVTDRRPHRKVRAILAKAPCPNPDTSAVERLLREDKAVDPARLEAVACDTSMGYQSASPDTLPPETAAVNPSSAEPIFITPYDSIAH